jgi:hypothetical protein
MDRAKRRALRMRQEGKKWSEITETTGLQGGQLYRLFKLHGLLKERRHVSTDPDFMDECARLKKGGLKNKEIAAILGVSNHIVSAALRRRGFRCTR